MLGGGVTGHAEGGFTRHAEGDMPRPAFGSHRSKMVIVVYKGCKGEGAPGQERVLVQGCGRPNGPAFSGIQQSLQIFIEHTFKVTGLHAWQVPGVCAENQQRHHCVCLSYSHSLTFLHFGDDAIERCCHLL